MKIVYKVLLMTGLALGAGWPAWGQSAATACDGQRYAADVFAGVTQTAGILYGRNLVRDYSQGTDTPKDLLLDFYEPTGDSAARRPLIIFAFGGSFVSGQRQSVADLCRAFALKGYATATIDYRLVPAGPNGFNYALVFGSQARFADQLVRAVSDMKAAVRFFRRDAATSNTYRIDPTKIFVAGYSAGGVTALLTAYINSIDEDSNLTAAFAANGGLEGDTDLPAPNNALPTYNAANLAGTLSLAGAVTRLSVLKATDPPLYAAHGDADTTVPYGSGPAFGSSPYIIYGGGSLHARADSVGLRNQLYTIVGGDHASTRQEPNATAINTAAAAFFQGLICDAPLPVGLVSFKGQLDAGASCAATLAWRTASELNSRAYEVQASADGQAFAPLGTVASRNSLTGAAYTYRVGSLEGSRYFRLKMSDFDGTYTYSPTVVLTPTCAPASLRLAPNPAHDQVRATALPAGTVRLLLYTATGQCVAQVPAQPAAAISLAGLPPGVYLLRAVDENGAAHGSARLVKE